jgi:hypothetical protein
VEQVFRKQMGELLYKAVSRRGGVEHAGQAGAESLRLGEAGAVPAVGAGAGQRGGRF